MSRIANKLNKTPVRSPSPDTACRHIIQRTPSPINEVLTKSRKKLTLKSPIGSGFINPADYEQTIRNLQEQNKILSSQNQYLIDENQKNVREIEFLKDMNLKHRKEIYKKSQTNLNRQPEILAAYEAKINELSGEFVRLQDLLSSEKRQRQGQEDRVYMLEKELQQAKEQQGIDYDLLSSETKRRLQEIQYTLKQSFNIKIEQYQTKVELVLQEEINKVDKIEREQRGILKLLQNQKYPPKTKKEGSTAHKSAEKSDDLSSHDEKECQNCKAYLLIISQLQAQIKRKSNTQTIRANPTRSQSPSSSSPDIEAYLRKLQQIKMTLQSQEFQSIINDVQINYNAFYTLQENYDTIISAKNNQIMQYQRRDLKAMMEISGLKKENRVLEAKLSKQQQQLVQLKRIITVQIQKFRPPEQMEFISKKRHSSEQADIIRRHIERIVAKVENLQEEISNHLKQ